VQGGVVLVPQGTKAAIVTNGSSAKLTLNKNVKLTRNILAI